MTYDTLTAAVRRQRILDDIEDERDRQDAQWGDQSNLPDGTLRQLEGRALAARDECRDAAREGRVSWLHILNEEVSEAFAETERPALRAELVQVAAVAVAWLEALDLRQAIHDARQGGGSS